MEIIVQGKAKNYFTPNEVVLNINFFTKKATYEEALNYGVDNVQTFIDEILINNSFTKEDMKTRNFIIREESKYNIDTKQHDHDGYSFSQFATIKFDYDKKRLAKIIEEISKLSTPPKCNVNFGVKNKEECQRTILASAYQAAEEQAKAIASAAGRHLLECKKVDFKPFTTEYISNSMFDSDMVYARKEKATAADTIVNTFNPEDIEISETLYCLWITD